MFFGYSLDLFAQTNPAGVHGALAWFITEEDPNTPVKWTWVDHSQYGLELIPSNNGTPDDPYLNEAHSVNFNPGLLFGTSHTHYTFTTVKSLKVHHTVIGVMIPYDPADIPQWALYEDDYIAISALGADSYFPNSTGVAPYNYGVIEDNSSDLDPDNMEGHPNDEPDRWGKIVTTNVYSNPDRCWDIQELHRRLFEVNSVSQGVQTQQTGLIPEFIVFDRILTEEERMRVESYLAIKYGMSKYEDYLRPSGTVIWDYDVNGDCNREDYLNRITGIGSNDFFLNQSKSTSYYDEFVNPDNRKRIWETYDHPDEDYSHHAHRTLAISIEDESSIIEERWGDDAYLIWGDNDLSVTSGEFVALNDFDGYERIPRIWKTQYTPNGGTEANGISWCNFINMQNDMGLFSRRFEEMANYDRDGVLASSTPIETNAIGSLNWTISAQPNGSETALIGLSWDNHHFVGEDMMSSEVEDCDRFVLALEFMDNGTCLLRMDDNQDGRLNTTSSFTYSTNDIFSLTVDIQSDRYQFSLLRNSMPVQPAWEILVDEPKELYAKGIIMDDEFEIGSFQGSGFKDHDPNQSLPGPRTNVEISYDKLINFFPNANKDQQVCLLQNTVGDENFPDDGTTIEYPGVYSRTPNLSQNKIEFYGIPWTPNGCDIFTLAKKPCRDWEVQVVNTLEDCCGQGAYLEILIKGCPLDPGDDLELCFGDGIPEICFENIPLGQPTWIYLPNGTHEVYSICPNDLLSCDYDFEFDQVLIDNQNSLDFDVVPDEHCYDGTTVTFDLQIDESPFDQVMYSWTGPNMSSGTDEIIIDDISDIGTYDIFITVTCPSAGGLPPIMCTITDQLIVTDCTPQGCELSIEVFPCGYVEVCLENAPGECRFSYDIDIQGGNDVIDVQINNGECVMHMLPPGVHVLTFDDPLNCCVIDPQTFTVDWLAGDLFTQEEIYLCDPGDGGTINLCDFINVDIYNDPNLCPQIELEIDGAPVALNCPFPIGPNQVSCSTELELTLTLGCNGTIQCQVTDMLTIFDCNDASDANCPIQNACDQNCPPQQPLLQIGNKKCLHETDKQVVSFELKDPFLYADKLEFEVWYVLHNVPVTLVSKGFFAYDETVELPLQSEGTYLFIATSINGATSSEIFELSYDSPLPSDILLDSIVYVESGSVAMVDATLDSSLNASYQWSGTDDFYSVDPLVELPQGSYSVKVTAGDCQEQDWIKIVPIDTTELRSLSKGTTDELKISFVNPLAKNRNYLFTAECRETHPVMLNIYSQEGKLIRSVQSRSATFHGFDIKLNTGLYFLEFRSTNESQTLKVVVQ